MYDRCAAVAMGVEVGDEAEMRLGFAARRLRGAVGAGGLGRGVFAGAGWYFSCVTTQEYQRVRLKLKSVSRPACAYSS
jgi:hypothetical protein